jgi:hypothetical protein
MESRVPQHTRALNGDALLAAVRWVVDAKIFSNLKFHGNTSWNPVDLIVLTVVWAWSERSNLTDAFEEARHWSTKVLQRSAVRTYQGLMHALVRHTKDMLPLLWDRLHALLKQHGDKHWRVGKWVPLAVDGSRVNVPRSAENERAFCAPNFGGSSSAAYRRRKRRLQGRTARRRRRQKLASHVRPQIWLTLLWHMGLCTPWSWKHGPSHASERDHFAEMLRSQKFPKNTLFCADAGFTGYELWKTAIDAGHHLLIRVGANVKLLRKLGYCTREREGIVYCWPRTVAAAREPQPPLSFRLIRVQLGKAQACLLTSVLSDRQLSAAQALRLYRMRWGVELQFRTLKQTFGRSKLRSRNPERALVELDWALMALTILQLFAVKEQIRFGDAPENSSASLAIRIVRETVNRWHEKPVAGLTLHMRLRIAVVDDYQRTASKKARYRYDFKDKPCAKQPRITNATKKHKQWLQRYLAQAA